MNIFVMQAGQRTGPFNEEQIREGVELGRITPQTLIWWNGQADWLPCSSTPFMSYQSRQAIAPAVYSPQPIAPVAPPTQAAPVVIIREAPSVPSNINATFGGSRGSGMAMAALGCGVLSLFTFFPCIPAIILGHLARGAIRRDPSLTGGGMATSGLVLGYLILICGVVSTLAFICGVSLLAIFAAANSH